MFMIALLATGNDPADWTSLESLDIPDPDALFQPFAEVVPLADGHDRGRGSAIATWRLAIARNAQRSSLRTFIPGTSADVYISTTINEDDSSEDPIFKNFQAIAHWMPGQENKQVRATLDVELKFTGLIEIPPIEV